jgi:hypothetical protein
MRWFANSRHSDSSGAERKDEDDTSTAILKKKKKPNQLMYVIRDPLRIPRAAG